MLFEFDIRQFFDYFHINIWHIESWKSCNMRPFLRSHDQRRRSSTTNIGAGTADQSKQLRGRSPSSSASNLVQNGKLSPLMTRIRLDSHLLQTQNRCVTKEHMTPFRTRKMSLPGDKLLVGESVTCGSQDNVSRRLPVSVDCDVTQRRPSNDTVKRLQCGMHTGRLSRDISDDSNKFESHRISSAKQDYGLQMKIIITLVIITIIVITVMILSHWIKNTTFKMDNQRIWKMNVIISCAYYRYTRWTWKPYLINW